MSGKLFAFNVSKMTGKTDEEARNQWRGDQTARAAWECQFDNLCSGGQSYGLAACINITSGFAECCLSGGSGYYVCDHI